MTNFVVSAPVEHIKQSATPSAPPTGTLLLYPKTDDKLYVQTSAGVETQVGSSYTLNPHVKGPYNSGVTYAVDDVVQSSDNNLYVSQIASNLNNTPGASGTAGSQSNAGDFIAGNSPQSITFQVTQTLTVSGINVGVYNGTPGPITHTLSGSDITTVAATGTVGTDVTFPSTVVLHTGITYTLALTGTFAGNYAGNTSPSYSNISNESTIFTSGAKYLTFTLKGSAGLAPWVRVLDLSPYLTSAAAAATYQTIASAASAVPTVIAASTAYSIPTNTQTLFRRKITLNAGSRITAAAGGCLVGV